MLEQSFHAGPWRGHRVRYSGELRTDGANVQASLYLLAMDRTHQVLVRDDVADPDAAGAGRLDAQRNRAGRAGRGGGAAARRRLPGRGQVAIRALHFEPVGPDVPATAAAGPRVVSSSAVAALKSRLRPDLQSPGARGEPPASRHPEAAQPSQEPDGPNGLKAPGARLSGETAPTRREDEQDGLSSPPP